uniref:Uncharacterized protein n=1 Tax=Arundo donax TaxID=35708 RepID=A0A0A9DZ82_ARUDO
MLSYTLHATQSVPYRLAKVDLYGHLNGLLNGRNGFTWPKRPTRLVIE